MLQIMTPVFFLVFASTIVVAAAAEQASEQRCQCGVFPSQTSGSTIENPIVTKTPNIAIECGEAGEEICSKLCVALAEAAKDKAPAVLCKVLAYTDQRPFTPMVYSKACGNKAWTNTGLHSNLQVCCFNKLPVPCSNA